MERGSMVTDLPALWDFSKPRESEQRFLAAMADATRDDALVLQTQIARTYGLRGDFERARKILSEIEPQVRSAGPISLAYYHLELGRSYASATHPPNSITPANRELARSAYTQAFELAKDAGLDDLAVDALHMMTFVDSSPEDQVQWNRKALTYVLDSGRPEARRWAGSLHNNMGYSLHALGRYEEALEEFELALAIREEEGDPERVRIARWMIAWTYRSLGRLHEALALQLRLERECDDAGQPDPFVYEELENLHRQLGNLDQADHFATKRKTLETSH
jgi:tetratricopeptide (TPR) repeat protein